MEEAEELKKETKREVAKNTFVAPTPGFLHAKFPFENDAKVVLDQLTASGVYGTRNWKGTPSSDAEEMEYHSFFASRANDIIGACRQLKGSDSGRHFECRWVVGAPGPPEPPEEFAALIRPGVLLTLVSEDEATTWSRREEEINSLVKTFKQSKPNKEISSRLREKLAIWWSRVLAVIELKVEAEADHHVEKLVIYMKHILGEQLDRRSALGLLLNKRNLTVWQCDRSGILGIKQAFDIHKEPQLFVQVILGLAFGEPEKLGFDTSMKLWRGVDLPPLPSFDPKLRPEDYDIPSAAKHWIINMPTKSVPSQREEFLTIEVLKKLRARTSFGRATVVWVVMRLKDVHVPDHDIFVLKQTWDSTSSISESQLIPKNVKNVITVYSSSSVYSLLPGNHHKIPITTVEYLRHSLPLSLIFWNPQGHRVMKGKDQDQENCGVEDAGAGLRDHEIVPHQYAQPISREQRRIVLEEFGWPVHQFGSLRELLETFRQVIVAQKNIYFKHKTLQRDISLGNILICPTNNNKDCMHTSATIIDFHQARKTERTMPSILGAASRLSHQPAMALYMHKTLCLTAGVVGGRPFETFPDQVFGVYLDDEYVKRLLTLESRLRVGSEGRSEKVTAKMLGFLPKHRQIPDFTPRRRGISEGGYGTAPFTSPEILTRQPIYAPVAPRPERCRKDWSWAKFRAFAADFRPEADDIFHDAVHDSDALFWVFTYICLTRAGPGRRRPELDEVDGATALTRRFDDLFNSEVNSTAHIANSKAEILGSNKPDITHLFAPYFKPVIKLWEQWRSILSLKYQYPASFETFHDFLVNAVSKAMDELPDGLSGDEEKAEKRVIETRERQLRYLRNFPAASSPVFVPHSAGDVVDRAEDEDGNVEVNVSEAREK